MPPPTNWYCGHCSYGPMAIAHHEYCVICYRQRDSLARYEALKVSTTNASTTVMLPPTTHPKASTLECLPLDTSEPDSAVNDQGETPTDSTTRQGHQRTGYYSHANGLSRGQTVYCQQPAATKWYCCQCRHPYTLIVS